MPRKRNRRYLIEIKDAKGVSVFFTAADWSDGERRAAVAQILRLNGVPEVYDFSEPSLRAKRGKDSDAKTKGRDQLADELAALD